MANRIKQTLGTIIVGAGLSAAVFAGWKGWDYLADRFAFNDFMPMTISTGEDTNREDICRAYRGIKYCGMPDNEHFSLSETSLFSKLNVYFSIKDKIIKFKGRHYEVYHVDSNGIELQSTSERRKSS